MPSDALREPAGEMPATISAHTPRGRCAVEGRGSCDPIERLPGAAPRQQDVAIERRAIEVVDNVPHGAGEAMQLRTSGLSACRVHPFVQRARHATMT